MTAPTEAGPTFCYRHPRRETYVFCTRCGKPICPDCMHVAAVGFQCPDCVRSGNRTIRPARGAYGGRPALTGRAEVTMLLVAANVVVFLITVASGGAGLLFGSSSSSSAYQRFALIPYLVAQHHEYYRFVTSMFLHYGVFHILFNMMALWYVGTPLERVLGRIRYLVVYFVAGIGGAVASYAFGPLGERGAGASGAIFGLFGAYFVIARRTGSNTGGIVGLIVINLVISVSVPNIDLRAHVGGLISGGLAAAAIAYAPRGRWRLASQVLGVALVGLILVAIAVVRTSHLRHQLGL